MKLEHYGANGAKFVSFGGAKSGRAYVKANVDHAPAAGSTAGDSG